VALTFDDGPTASTAAFLAVLVAKQVPATFCMIGRQVLAQPEVVRQAAAAEMTLCNHTFDHNEHLSTAGAATVNSDLQRGIDAQTKVVGKTPVLYRPPGGDLSQQVEQIAAAKANKSSAGPSIPATTAARPPQPSWTGYWLEPSPEPSSCSTTAAATAPRHWPRYQ